MNDVLIKWGQETDKIDYVTILEVMNGLHKIPRIKEKLIRWVA